MKIFEVGVGNPSVCRTAKETTNECWLFEPNPFAYAQLVDMLHHRGNFKILNYAIGDFNGKIDIYLNDNFSFLKNIQSPTTVQSFSEGSISLETRQVNCYKIDYFDDGKIDHLILDMEGAEWFALKYLLSRPQFIDIKLSDSSKNYTNPYIEQIAEWLVVNNYKPIDNMTPTWEQEFLRMKKNNSNNYEPMVLEIK